MSLPLHCMVLSDMLFSVCVHACMHACDVEYTVLGGAVEGLRVCYGVSGLRVMFSQL